MRSHTALLRATIENFSLRGRPWQVVGIRYLVSGRGIGSGDRCRCNWRNNQIDQRVGHYCEPVWTLDGSSVVALRAPQSVVLQQPDERPRPVDGLELVSIPADSGPAKMILPAPHYTFPHFAGKDGLLFVTELQKPNLLNVDYSLVSMRPDGSQRHTVLRLTHKNIGSGDATPPIKIEVSPNGERALAIDPSEVYVFDLPAAGGAAPTLDLSSPAVATKKIDIDRSGFRWLGRRREDDYVESGFDRFRLPLAERRWQPKTNQEKDGGAKNNVEQGQVQPNSPEAAGKVHPEAEHELVQVARSTPDGTVVLQGAKVVTMRGEEVLNSADIVIYNNSVSVCGDKRHSRSSS